MTYKLTKETAKPANMCLSLFKTSCCQTPNESQWAFSLGYMKLFKMTVMYYVIIFNNNKNIF